MSLNFWAPAWLESEEWAWRRRRSTRNREASRRFPPLQRPEQLNPAFSATPAAGAPESGVFLHSSGWSTWIRVSLYSARPMVTVQLVNSSRPDLVAHNLFLVFILSGYMIFAPNSFCPILVLSNFAICILLQHFHLRSEISCSCK
jgi:hypothetical protein